MSQPELDWSFDEAPQEPGEDERGAVVLGAPPPPPRPRWWRNPRRLRLALAVGALLLVVGAVSAWVVTRLGWQRVEQQLTEEVRYEDEQAALGQAALALSVWADTGEEIYAWRQLRERTAQAHLAVPLPAAHLAPAPWPPVVAEITPLPASRFDVVVLRAYLDSAGQVYTFTLTQRYRSLGGGLWERQPPDLEPLRNTTTLAGHRLSAVLPVDDLAWLADSLLAADAALVRACADWGDLCPAERRLDIVFTADPQLVTAEPAGPGAAAGFGPYPAAFDVAGRTPSLNQVLRLPSLALSGAPADAAAQDALTRALVAHGLAYLAQSIASTAARPGDPFFAALVGRAEARLGLAPPLTYTLRAEHYRPPSGLFETTRDLSNTPAWTGGLPYQLLAYDFLDQALAGQPPAADGALLRSLCRQRSLYPWLEMVLERGGGHRAEAAWLARAQDAFTAESDLPLAAAEGLVYNCGEPQSWLIRDGQRVRVPYTVRWAPPFSVELQALSPDGRYLATTGDTEPPAITILDLTSDWSRRIELAHGVYMLSWSGAGALVYVEAWEPEGDPSTELGRAMRLDIHTGERRPLTDLPVAPNLLGGASWLADRSAMLLNVLFDLEPGAQGVGLWNSAPALVPVDVPGAPRRLAAAGYGAALSPDGQWVAFGLPTRLGDQEWTLDAVSVVNLNTGATRTLVESAGLPTGAGEGVPYFLFPMQWSPGSDWVLVVAGGDGVHLYAVPLDGGAPWRLTPPDESGGFNYPLGFSADGRTLAYVAYSNFENDSALVLADLSDFGGAPPPLTVLARGIQFAAWSPDQQVLAMSGETGVRVVNPATGAWRWIDLAACGPLMWIP